MTYPCRQSTCDCPPGYQSTVGVIPATCVLTPPTPLPTLSEWGLGALILCVLLMAWRRV